MSSHTRINWLFPLSLVMYEISLYLSNDMYLPALPEMMTDLSLTAAEAQLTITMWFLGSASVPLVIGALADRFGRRPTLLVGGILYVIATIICAMATNEYNLLVPRILQGAMISTMMVAGYACIHELYDHTDAIRILAIMGGISVLAPALGPLFGAVMLQFASWRWIFWFIASFSSVMLISLYFYMPETISSHQKQSLHFSTIIKKYWQVLANKNFLLLMAVLGLTFAGFICWVTAGPLLVIQSLKFSEVMFGWMQAAVFAAYIFGSYLVNELLKKHPAERLIHIGLFISLVAGLLMLFCSLQTPDHFGLFLTTVIAYSFGSALSFAPLNRLIIETSDQPMGIRVAMFTTGLMGSGVLGSGIASLIYDGSSFSLAIIIAIGIIIACGLAYLHARWLGKPAAPHA